MKADGIKKLKEQIDAQERNMHKESERKKKRKQAVFTE